ncbi:MAG TPA: glycosyltransferase family 2 protein [Nitrospira sp.]|nr:glycosyltransferase family 2 protein [Nitrospira sp.]
MTERASKPDDAARGSFAVIIINHNTRPELDACLSSLPRKDLSHVIVVDNDSIDGSAGMVTEKYPWVSLHANKTNVGYGAAANQAIAECTSEYLLLLNSDTRLQAGAIPSLGRYLGDHPRAAIVGPRLVNEDGTLQASCYSFPTPIDTILENSAIAVFLGQWIRNRIPGIRRLYWRTWPHDAARLVPWVKGAALAIRRKAFQEVGGFDISFFMYFEDADLCWRLRQAGWEIHFAPVTTVTHVGGASTAQVRSEMAVQLLQSTDLFYRRHRSRVTLVLMRIMVKMLILGKWLTGSLRLVFTHDVHRQQRLCEDRAAWQQALFRRSTPIGHTCRRIS